MSTISFDKPTFLTRPLVTKRFIETGLYEGDSMAAAAEEGFDQLDGIECSAFYVARCFRRFHQQYPRVQVHGGASVGVLGAILEDVPTTFWLDAHFTGDPLRPDLMDRESGECPLLEEIRVIQQFCWTEKPVIMIDDLHMYEQAFWETPEARNFTRREWPTLEQLRSALLNYEFIPFNGVIYAF